VPALSFSDLVARLGVTSVRTLVTDLEGMDAVLLPTFPFERVRPDQLVFEYKHADGPRNIGRRLGALLIRLDELGYRMQIVDLENCVAVHRDVAPAPRR
jgi:hypothetical protein